MSFSNTTKLVENFKRRKAVHQAPVNWLAEKLQHAWLSLRYFNYPGPGSQRTISTCVMYYSKFERELSSFSKVLTEWSLTRT